MSDQPHVPPGPLDMDPEEFRRHGYAAIDRIADYLAHPGRWPVLPDVAPGDLRRQLPAHPPDAGEPMEALLRDFDQLVLPHTTHWNHPGFLAYFANTASGPGILGELLAAGLNVNAMLWRTGPAATELEETATDWLRQLMGLPAGLDGTINDTASSSTLYALAAARELQSDLKIREEGLPGRSAVPPLRVYCSREAHSSVDKAVLTLGLGLAGIRHIDTDPEDALDPARLAQAIAQDRAAGIRPLAVVATVGTTSTTAVDPVPAIADICRQEGIWLHVDASYAGAAAILPEMRHILAGCDQADSLVVNPHKWLLTPMDCSVLYTRRPDLLRQAFSLVPEYLATTDPDDVRNLMDYGVSLGRRFRALKLWFVLRWFGAEGLRSVIRYHLELARELGALVDADPGFQRLAPVRFSAVLFRCRPHHLAEEEALTALNAEILRRVNASGRVFLSHTKVYGQYALRVAIGNGRTSRQDVHEAWRLVREAARQLQEAAPPAGEDPSPDGASSR
jgi:aromatic-L-amino-acid/L-tryptophan decarboxylase